MHPVRSVTIQGMTARAFALVKSPQQDPRNVVSVKTAAEADKALGDEGNEHHCPLCNEFFGTAAFKAHAPQCIEARAPRTRIWGPPGFSANTTQAYSEERPSRPGGGLWGSY